MEAMLARAQLDFTTPNTILILAVESENLIGNKSFASFARHSEYEWDSVDEHRRWCHFWVDPRLVLAAICWGCEQC